MHSNVSKMKNSIPSQISSYGVIGNCRTAALVSDQGSIDWCCFPKFDSPSHFAKLLDPKAGHFSITPIGSFQSTQTYIEGTNILQTRFENSHGSSILTDFFSVKSEGVHPNELWPDEEILRILEGKHGIVTFKMQFHPKRKYGTEELQLSPIGNWGIKACSRRKHFLLQFSFPCSLLQIVDTSIGRLAEAEFQVHEGEQIILSLSYSEESPSVMPPLSTVMDRFDHTYSYWKSWSSSCKVEGPYSSILRRSALALKLLNYAPSGAFIAAPTTSLPEWVGGPRNWDYRFCWLRDAAFTTRALLSIGHIEEAKSFLNWLIHSTRLTAPKLQVLYTVYGESKVSESEIKWMTGFQNSKPVRIGNEASTQLQLDVYGEVLDSLYSLLDHLNPVDHDTKQMVIGFGESVAKLWREPDQGIWEFRSNPKHFTHSKVMCWVAMDRLRKLAAHLKWKLPYNSEKIANEIRTEIEEKGFNAKMNTYTQSFGETELDSALLVMPLVGYCSADYPKFLATRNAIIQHLSKNNVVYRYSYEKDNLSTPEGAFTICNFWLAQSFAKSGDLYEAQKWFHAVTDHLPGVGLSSEELNPENYSFLGNYHQGFSHIGLINAALEMSELEKNLNLPKEKTA